PARDPRAARRGRRARRLPRGVGAAHRADPDRRHRLPLRLRRVRRGAARRPAALGRRRRASQGGDQGLPPPGTGGAPERLPASRRRPMMEKLMKEHRKRFGRFEVIEFVDEAEIERLRAKTDVAAPLTLHWTWEYGSEVEELRALYEKGKLGQWNAERDLDWAIPVSKDDWVMKPEASMLAQICKLMGKDEATQKAAAFDELAHLLSQLLHGEQAAL